MLSNASLAQNYDKTSVQIFTRSIYTPILCQKNTSQTIQ